jgi:hypothetical protein
MLKMRTHLTALTALAAALPPIALRTVCLVRLSALTSPQGAFDISVQRLIEAKPFASVAFWRSKRRRGRRRSGPAVAARVFEDAQAPAERLDDRFH